MYNPATGVFTVVNDGLYVVVSQYCIDNFTAAPTVGGMFITVNGTAVTGTNGAKDLYFYDSGNAQTSKLVWEVELMAGDTVQVSAFVDNGGSEIIGTSEIGPIFTGSTFASIRQVQ